MFWTGLMHNGAAGGTYGANGIWQVNRRDVPYGPSPHGRSWGSIPWDEAMKRPSSTQVALAKRFWTRYPWYRFEPKPETVSWADAPLPSDHVQPCAAGAADLRIVYVPRPHPVLIKRLMPQAEYAVELFDPVSGESFPQSTCRTEKDGLCLYRPLKQKHDWVAILRPVGNAPLESRR
jgi:hypothetical protein